MKIERYLRFATLVFLAGWLLHAGALQAQQSQDLGAFWNDGNAFGEGDDRLLQTLQAQQAKIAEQEERIRRLEAAMNGNVVPVQATQPSPTPIEAEAGVEFAKPIVVCPEVEGNVAPVIIGGQYRLMFNASNYDWHSEELSDDQRSQTFFNQRFRTWLTVRPNDQVEGYLQVEMGHIAWGENYDYPKTYVGPRFPGADDRVGIELRRGYLTYRAEPWGVFRAGILGEQDRFDQTLFSSDWDFNLGGLVWERTCSMLGDADFRLGLFAVTEGDYQAADDTLLLTLDVDWNACENRNFGVSAYYLSDRGEYSYPTVDGYDESWDVWLGARTRFELWGFPLHAFALYNFGERRDSETLPLFQHDGVGLKLETGPVPVGSGAISAQVLYSSGDGDPDPYYSTEFRTVAQSERDNFGAQGYWSYLVITSPDGPSDVNDLGVGLQNRGLGLFTVQMQYVFPVFERLDGRLAAGWLRSDVRRPASGSFDMGTEIANVYTLDLGGGLTADMGAAVFWPGNFYKSSSAAASPDTLYEAFTRLQLVF
ncbi:hypothetical protein [Thermostilla marina]